MELNRMDYFYLKLFEQKKCTGFFQSMTIQEVKDEIGGDRSNIYKRLHRLYDLGYLAKGCKSANADTFYVTDAGHEILKIGGLEEDVKK